MRTEQLRFAVTLGREHRTVEVFLAGPGCLSLKSILSLYLKKKKAPSAVKVLFV